MVRLSAAAIRALEDGVENNRAFIVRDPRTLRHLVAMKLARYTPGSTDGVRGIIMKAAYDAIGACPDCGMSHASRGHQECQYPSNHS